MGFSGDSKAERCFFDCLGMCRNPCSTWAVGSWGTQSSFRLHQWWGTLWKRSCLVGGMGVGTVDNAKLRDFGRSVPVLCSMISLYLPVITCFVSVFPDTPLRTSKQLLLMLSLEAWPGLKSSLNESGQIRSRPHTTDFPQMVVKSKGNPRLFQRNLAWWNNRSIWC